MVRLKIERSSGLKGRRAIPIVIQIFIVFLFSFSVFCKPPNDAKIIPGKLILKLNAKGYTKEYDSKGVYIYEGVKFNIKPLLKVDPFGNIYIVDYIPNIKIRHEWSSAIRIQIYNQKGERLKFYFSKIPVPDDIFIDKLHNLYILQSDIYLGYASNKGESKFVTLIYKLSADGKLLFAFTKNGKILDSDPILQKLFGKREVKIDPNVYSKAVNNFLYGRIFNEDSNNIIIKEYNKDYKYYSYYFDQNGFLLKKENQVPRKVDQIYKDEQYYRELYKGKLNPDNLEIADDGNLYYYEQIMPEHNFINKVLGRKAEIRVYKIDINR